MFFLLDERTCSRSSITICAPAFSFRHTPPIGDTRKRRSPENGKMCGFPPFECDRITDRHGIWHINVEDRSALTHQI